MGVESPAPSVYNPQFKTILVTQPQFSIGRERRFKEDLEAPLRKRVPHAYETNLKKRAYRSGGFDRADRFSHSVSQEQWY